MPDNWTRPTLLNAFDRPDTIYKAVGNFEGKEFAFQRGFLFDQVSKLPEARQPRASARLAKLLKRLPQAKTLQKLGT